MADPQSDAAEILKLNNEEYFAMTDAEVLALQTQFAAQFPEVMRPPNAPPDDPADAPQILAIGAPSSVSLNSERGIPVLVASRQNGYRRWMVDYRQNACLVLTDLNTGVVHIGQPFMRGKRVKTPEPSQTPPAPDVKAALATLTSIRRIDLRSFLHVQWFPTRAAVTVLDYDWKSNTVQIDLTHEGVPMAKADPRYPSDFIKITPRVTPDETTFYHQDRVPFGAPLLLQVQINMPKGHIAVGPSQGPDGSSLVAATFFLMRLDERDPARVDIAAPILSLEGGTVQSAFEFEMAAAFQRQPPAGTYVTYLVAGDVIIGPQRLTIASP